MKEIWKPIKGYKGIYEISNLGRVKSLDRLIKKGEFYWRIKGCLRKLFPDRYGYINVRLSKNGKSKNYLVHRLVIEHFSSKNSLKNEVNHINGVKSDNSICNLQWVNRSENIKHCFNIGLRSHKGENNTNCKLRKVDVIEIYNSNKTAKELSDKYGVKESAIYSIRKGIRWTHVTKHNLKN